jgi:hypothetical protein
MKVAAGKLLLALASLGALTGCASIGPPEAPSLELPKPPSDLRAARKGNKVTLTWTIPARTTERQSVRYLGKTEICRSLAPFKQCENRVGESVPPPDFEAARKSSAKKAAATFTDTLPSALQQEQPTGYANYAIEVMNSAGRSAGISNQVRVPLLLTLQPFDNFAVQATAPGMIVSWHCPSSSGTRTGIAYLFRIYRRPESSSSETKVADVPATPCAVAVSRDEKPVTSFLDQTFEWENTYFYRGTVVSVMELAGKPLVEVEGDDTAEMKVFAHDVFPPAVPAGVQAVFSGPGQQPFIDLIWAPSIDADLDGYNIYRHEAGGATVKLNPEPVKTPAFRDLQVVSRSTYFYSVSAIDQRGNESARSEEATESAP